MYNSVIKVLVCSLSIVCCQQCTKRESKTINPLEGHWHNIDDRYDLTMDIDDSLVVLNKYSLFEYPETFPLFDSVNHKPSLPIPCGCGSAVLPVIDKFQIVGDTLIYDNKMAEECYAFTPFQFIRCNIKNCNWTQHYFPGQEVSLENFDSMKSMTIDLDSLRRNSVIINIAVGYPKSEEFGNEPKIQEMGVFIELEDISKVIAERKSLYLEDKITPPTVVCLVMDTSIPRDYAEMVINAIPKNEVSEVLHLVSFENGKKLGFERLLY
jgi:hypothetical protein